jgi:glycosyltransferase involved in cell wall biosynthesis
MRLDVFHPGFESLGGAESLALAQARGLRAHGFEPRIASFRIESATWADQLDGLPTLAIAKRAPWDLLFGVHRRGRLEARLRRVRAALGDSPVVLAHNFPASAMAGHLGGPGRSVWYSHEPPRPVHPGWSSPLLDTLSAGRAVPEELRAAVDEHRQRLAREDHDLAAWERAGVARLAAVVANSEFTAGLLRRIYGRCEAVVPPLVSAAGDRRAPRGSSDALEVLVVSRLEPIKNVGTVLRGFALHLAHHPGARLHVVGEGRERARLEQLTTALGLAARVHFHGALPAPALEALRARTHVFALVPVDEPFGMVFAEAALAGQLVVGPNQGGPLEILDGGALGTLADPREPAGVAEALDRLASLPGGEAESLRERAAAACRARYAPQVLLPRLAALLHG